MQIKKLSENAIVPTKGSDGAAGYDLYSTEDYVLKPGERKLFKTNISLAIPKNYYGRIAPRSGLAYKNGIDVLGGVIDSDYRGDIGVILLNTNSQDKQLISNLDGVITNELKPLEVKKGDRIAQIIFEQYFEADFIEVKNLDETVRDSGGWGSTGK